MRIAVLLGLILIAFAVNLPLGRLRVRAGKFSWRWFLYVHASIPVILALRITSGFGLAVAPLLIAGAIGGQLLGGSLGA